MARAIRSSAFAASAYRCRGRRYSALQLRALARAAVHGTLKVMLPMVAVPAELDRARACLTTRSRLSGRKGIACARPPLGIMVEVPAAALCAEDFDAAFYSIGSNDLTQYTMAAARDIGSVADLNDAGNPAVLALIARTVEAARSARRRGLAVRRRGRRYPPDDGAARDWAARLSVAPVAVARLKATIATVGSMTDG